MPSISLNFVSGSLKPEINYIFTNSTLGLVSVCIVWKSKERVSSAWRIRKLRILQRLDSFSAVTTLALGEMYFWFTTLISLKEVFSSFLKGSQVPKVRLFHTYLEKITGTKAKIN